MDTNITAGHQIGELTSLFPICQEGSIRIVSVAFMCSCKRVIKVPLKTIRQNNCPTACKHCLKRQRVRTVSDVKVKSLREKFPLEYEIWKHHKHMMVFQWKRDFTQFLAEMGPKETSNLVLCRKIKEHKHGPLNSFWGSRKTKTNKIITVDGKGYTRDELIKTYGMPRRWLNARLREQLTGRDILCLWEELQRNNQNESIT
jgi:hypothetical protein